MKRALRNTTIADRTLFVILIMASLAGMFYTREALSQGDEVVIEVGGKAVFTASLDIDKEIPVKGSHGHAVVEIRNGKVRMKEPGVATISASDRAGSPEEPSCASRTASSSLREAL